MRIEAIRAAVAEVCLISAKEWPDGFQLCGPKPTAASSVPVHYSTTWDSNISSRENSL
jgi:hypothetical protein